MRSKKSLKIASMYLRGHLVPYEDMQFFFYEAILMDIGGFIYIYIINGYWWIYSMLKAPNSICSLL